MIDKIAALEKSLIQQGFVKEAQILKIALELIDKTDGTLSLSNIIKIEEDGFGLVFVNGPYSLSSQLNSVFDNESYIKQNISSNRVLLALYSQSKNMFKRKILETPITSLKNLVGENFINKILENFTQEDDPDDLPDEYVIFGSKEAYLMAGLYLDEEEGSAEIYDMSGDKSSHKYSSKIPEQIFKEFVNYCSEKNIKDIEFHGRESTSAKLMDFMSKRHERRKDRGLDHPEPFDKIDNIDNQGYAFTMTTKFSSNADKLMKSFNRISSNLKRVSEDLDNIDFEGLNKKINSSVNDISSILGEDSIISEIETSLFEEIKRVLGSGFFSNIMSNKKSKIDGMIREFLDKLRDDIFSYLKKDKYSHFSEEKYYEYNINLH